MPPIPSIDLRLVDGEVSDCPCCACACAAACWSWSDMASIAAPGSGSLFGVPNGLGFIPACGGGVRAAPSGGVPPIRPGGIAPGGIPATPDRGGVCVGVSEPAGEACSSGSENFSASAADAAAALRAEAIDAHDLAPGAVGSATATGSAVGACAGGGLFSGGGLAAFSSSCSIFFARRKGCRGGSEPGRGVPLPMEKPFEPSGPLA